MIKTSLDPVPLSHANFQFSYFQFGIGIFIFLITLREQNLSFLELFCLLSGLLLNRFLQI